MTASFGTEPWGYRPERGGPIIGCVDEAEARAYSEVLAELHQETYWMLQRDTDGGWLPRHAVYHKSLPPERWVHQVELDLPESTKVLVRFAAQALDMSSDELIKRAVIRTVEEVKTRHPGGPQPLDPA